MESEIQIKKLQIKVTWICMIVLDVLRSSKFLEIFSRYSCKDLADRFDVVH